MNRTEPEHQTAYINFVFLYGSIEIFNILKK